MFCKGRRGKNHQARLPEGLVGLEGLSSIILSCMEPWNNVYIPQGPTSPPGTFQWNVSIVLAFRLTSGLWEHFSLCVLTWRPKLYASLGSAESGRKISPIFNCVCQLDTTKELFQKVYKQIVFNKMLNSLKQCDEIQFETKNCTLKVIFDSKTQAKV
jgi:hypothetical protein